MKMLLSAAALAALLSTPVYAQTNTAPAAAADTPATTAPSPIKPADPMAAPMTKPAAAPAGGMADTASTTPATDAGSIKYLPAQGSGEMLASRVIGAYVMNNANETVGDINDIVLDKQGKVMGVVISVGGFLGLGTQYVAVSYEPGQITTDANGKRVIKLNVTKDALMNAPKYTKMDKAS